MVKTFKTWQRMMNPVEPVKANPVRPGNTVKTKPHPPWKRQQAISVSKETISLAWKIAHTGQDGSLKNVVTRLIQEEWDRLSDEQKQEAEAWYARRNEE